MYRGKISKYVFLLSAVIIGSLFWRCVDVPTKAPDLPAYLQDNQVRFVNALSVLQTDLTEQTPDTALALPADTLVMSISAIDSTFLYDTTEVLAADTATYSGDLFLDSLRHDSLEVQIVNGKPDTLLDSTWYTYRFITDTTVTAIDSTIDSTKYVPNGSRQIIERYFREDSALVSSIGLSVGEQGTAVTGIGFGAASDYLENWPVGSNQMVLTAMSDANTYRQITKRDTTFYTLSVIDTSGFYDEPAPDGYAESATQTDSMVSWVKDIATGTAAGDTITDSLSVTFPSDRKVTVLLHAPTTDGKKVTMYTDNYISTGPVSVSEDSTFALLRVINATSPDVSADVSLIAGSDTTALATGDDALGFTKTTGYLKYENVGAKTLSVVVNPPVYDPNAEKYESSSVTLDQQVTLEASKRYTAFIFQDGSTFSIAVMVDDE